VKNGGGAYYCWMSEVRGWLVFCLATHYGCWLSCLLKKENKERKKKKKKIRNIKQKRKRKIISIIIIIIIMIIIK